MNTDMVNRYIQHRIWSLVKKEGFACFTQRTAWRYRGKLIDIINFQSFNAYHAAIMDCTTYSFYIHLGIYLAVIPSGREWVKRKNDELIPHIAQAHITRWIIPKHQWPGKRHKEVWRINGQNPGLEKIFLRIEKEIRNTGLPWFGTYPEGRQLLDLLIHKKNLSEKNTVSLGKIDSPKRNEAIGYVAKELGENDIALRYLRRCKEQYEALDAVLAKQGKKPRKLLTQQLLDDIAQLS
jgi:hypothetical protein